MKTVFTVIRHGKTRFNEKGVFQGACDSPLLESSIQEAIQIGEQLKDVPFVYAASSTSERAMDTMEYILQGRMPYDYLKGLRETDYGILEGEPIPPMEERDMEQDWIGYACYGGEDYDPATDRFENTLREVAREGEVLIVSHGGVICHFLDRIGDGFKGNANTMVPNNSVTRILYQDGDFSIIDMPKTINEL